MIHKVLGLRKRLSEIFLTGGYRPLYAHGQKADHVVAFLRGKKVVAVVPRLLLSLKGEWGDTWLDIPKGHWRNHLTGDSLEDGNAMVRDILAPFPVALLAKE
jgi:(1->4)-alpha-D-glucan 1-alpha-D-glucosylmutase